MTMMRVAVMAVMAVVAFASSVEAQSDTCEDISTDCGLWLQYCEDPQGLNNHIKYMETFCKGTCGLCNDNFAGQGAAGSSTDSPQDKFVTAYNGGDNVEGGSYGGGSYGGGKSMGMGMGMNMGMGMGMGKSMGSNSYGSESGSSYGYLSSATSQSSNKQSSNTAGTIMAIAGLLMAVAAVGIFVNQRRSQAVTHEADLMAMEPMLV